VNVGELFPLPSLGDIFVDARGDDRTMRVSFHGDAGAVVLSLWAGRLCRGSFRMDVADVDRLISTLDDVRTSLGSAPVPAQQAAQSTRDDDRDAGTAVVEAPGSVQPPPEQTGDVTGSADRHHLRSVPVLRVA